MHSVLHGMSATRAHASPLVVLRVAGVEQGALDVKVKLVEMTPRTLEFHERDRVLRGEHGVGVFDSSWG